MGPSSNMTGVLIKRGNLGTDAQAERMPWKDEDRDGSDVAEALGC